jgi:hypothetical protein
MRHAGQSLHAIVLVQYYPPAYFGLVVGDQIRHLFTPPVESQPALGHGIHARDHHHHHNHHAPKCYS